MKVLSAFIIIVSIIAVFAVFGVALSDIQSEPKPETKPEQNKVPSEYIVHYSDDYIVICTEIHDLALFRLAHGGELSTEMEKYIVLTMKQEDALLVYNKYRPFNVYIWKKDNTITALYSTHESTE